MAALEGDHATVHAIDHLAVVRSDDHGGTGAVNALEQLHDAQRNRRVEVARGLVANQQRRAVDHSAGNGHALLLATGKLIGQRAHLVGQTDQTQHLGHLAANDALGLADALQGKRHVFVGGLLRQELKVLEHGANLTTQERNLAVLDLHEILAGDQNAAAGGLDVAVERRSSVVLPEPE